MGAYLCMFGTRSRLEFGEQLDDLVESALGLAVLDVAFFAEDGRARDIGSGIGAMGRRLEGTQVRHS